MKHRVLGFSLGIVGVILMITGFMTLFFGGYIISGIILIVIGGLLGIAARYFSSTQHNLVGGMR